MSTLTLQRCGECDYVAGFWRIGCPRCLGELQDVDAAGAGEVTTFSIVHRWVTRFEEQYPIVLAIILLEEGVEVVSSIVGDNRLDVEVGSRVVLAEEGWSTKPQFALAAPAPE